MGQAKKEDFCVYCREVRPYSVVRKNIRKRIRDKDYSFVITTGLTNSRMPDYFQQKMSGILPENSGLFSDPDHLDVLKSPFLENERLQPAHHAVFAVEKVGL